MMMMMIKKFLRGLCLVVHNYYNCIRRKKKKIFLFGFLLVLVVSSIHNFQRTSILSTITTSSGNWNDNNNNNNNGTLFFDQETKKKKKKIIKTSDDDDDDDGQYFYPRVVCLVKEEEEEEGDSSDETRTTRSQEGRHHQYQSLPYYAVSLRSCNAAASAWPFPPFPNSSSYKKNNHDYLVMSRASASAESASPEDDDNNSSSSSNNFHQQHYYPTIDGNCKFFDYVDETTTTTTSSSSSSSSSSWQTMNHPTCNDVHELSMVNLVLEGTKVLEQLQLRQEQEQEQEEGSSNNKEEEKKLLDSIIRMSQQQQQQQHGHSSSNTNTIISTTEALPYFFKSGSSRLGGILLADETSMNNNNDTNNNLFVYKTYQLKNNQNFTHGRYEMTRTEALIHELFSSPSPSSSSEDETTTTTTTTVPIYKFCGMFTLTQLGYHNGIRKTDGRPTFVPPTLPKDKLQFAIDISKAVSNLHTKMVGSPILYRDFDPINIVLTMPPPPLPQLSSSSTTRQQHHHQKRQQIKLIDFHQAMMLPRHPKTNEICYPTNESPPRFIDYAAPEIIMRQQLTEKSDIYGLGSLLFYILTDGARLYHCEKGRPITEGKCNFRDKSENTISEEKQIISLKMQNHPPALPLHIEEESYDPAIQIIRDVMKLAIQYDPTKRPTAQEIVTKLEQVYYDYYYFENSNTTTTTSADSTTGTNSGIKQYNNVSSPSPSSCIIPKAKYKEVTPEPVYVASYPGSGSEMMLNLLEALTGIKTESHGGNCDPPPKPYNYVAIKTHYPWHCKQSLTWQNHLDGDEKKDGIIILPPLTNALILIRNPINSFPSKANRQYEADTGQRGHSKQCPEDYWIQWRDKNFNKHLELWEELIFYWFDNRLLMSSFDSTNSNRLLVPYESLVSKDTGPVLAYRLGQFFEAKVTSPITEIHSVSNSSSPSTLQQHSNCVWKEVVAGDKSGRRSNIHRQKTYKPLFTSKQYDSILLVINRLRQRGKHNSNNIAMENLDPILDQYEASTLEQKAQVLATTTTIGGSSSPDRPRPRPKLAWLMSYPNSHNTHIRTLLQDTTQTTGATNYGHERIQNNKSKDHTFNSTSIPVYSDDGSSKNNNGPFIISDELPLPTNNSYILVKTHCGINGCRDCNVVRDVEDFINECATGVRVEEEEVAGSGKMKKTVVQYDVNMVERVVHLYSHPLANILTRFRGGSKKSYQDNRQGLLDWCQDYDQLYVQKSKNPELVPQEVLNRDDVLCHTEFFKYVQWHNHALHTIEELHLPSFTLYAEDFSNQTSFKETLSSLLQFLNITQVQNGTTFETKQPFSSYFNKTEVEAIMSFIQRYASEELWSQIYPKYHF